MKFRSIFVLFMVLSVVSGLAIAEEAVQPASEQPADAEKAAQMEKMKTLMAPGTAHKELEALTGKWTYTAKFWMAADSKPEETTGTAEASMIYGGRFLKQEVKGAWMGQPFEGTGLTGYDNIRGEYESIWYDSMATGIMVSAGQYDAATKTFGQSGTGSCPMTGEKDRKSRTEWTITDADHNTYSAYTTGPDGKEFKGMEIVYQRVA